MVSDEESSSHSQGEKPIRKIADSIASSDSQSERNLGKKNKKGIFGRFSSLRSGKNIWRENTLILSKKIYWFPPRKYFDSLPENILITSKKILWFSARKYFHSLRKYFDSFLSALSATPDSVTGRDVEAWADPTTGFESLMASPGGRQIFQKYLAGEFSAENLIFWTACKDLKSVKKKEIFKEKVEKIFLNHLETSSQYEVKLYNYIYTKIHQLLIKTKAIPGCCTLKSHTYKTFLINLCSLTFTDWL